MRATYQADGAQTSFDAAFDIFGVAEVEVALRNNATLVRTVQTDGVDYRKKWCSQDRNSIVFVAAPAKGHTVVIERAPGPAAGTPRARLARFVAETRDQKARGFDVGQRETLAEIADIVMAAVEESRCTGGPSCIFRGDA